MSADKTIRCHCNSCGRDTEHDLVAERVVEDEEVLDEYTAFTWTDTYQMLQCRGCQSVCLRDSYEDVANEKRVSYFPPPVSRRAPRWRWDLPAGIRDVMDEVYLALQSNSRRLALMGARTLVDLLMSDKIGNVGGFREKLDALRDKGVISEKGREVLETALDAGSAAAHRGFKPGADELNSVMDIVENLLQATYHLEKVACKVKAKTPTKRPNSS